MTAHHPLKDLIQSQKAYDKSQADKAAAEKKKADALEEQARALWPVVKQVFLNEIEAANAAFTDTANGFSYAYQDTLGRQGEIATGSLTLSAPRPSRARADCTISVHKTNMVSVHYFVTMQTGGSMSTGKSYSLSTVTAQDWRELLTYLFEETLPYDLRRKP